MAKKLSSVVGVDIGSQRIKICEMRTQGKEPVITALGMIDTPEGAVDHTGVYNSDAVGQALKQCLGQSGATVSNLVVSLAGQMSVLVRTLEVPKMNPTELQQHMEWEINRNVPFAESSILSDFKPLGGDDPNSANMDVVMAIAPQSAVDTILDCAKKAGRSIGALDVEPLSIARIIQQDYEDILGHATICVVDIGHMTTSINIYTGSKLLMPRTVPIGGEMVTKALADALMLPISEAERIKREQLSIPDSAGSMGQAANPFGMAGGADFQAFNPFQEDTSVSGYSSTPASLTQDFSSPPVGEPALHELYASEPPASSPPVPVNDSPDSKLYNAVAPVLEELVSEIRRSIDYYRSRGGDVQHVQFCGGGAQVGGFVPYMERSLGIKCDALDPLRRLNITGKKVPQGLIDDHRQEFAVAIGNGLHIFFD